MRQLILIVFCSIVFISCEKIEFKKDISGNWQLIGAGGGIVYHVIETNYSNLYLTRNLEYSIFSNNDLKLSSQFSIYSYKENPTPPFEPFYIKFNVDSIPSSITGFPFIDNLDVVFKSRDTLILSSWDVDGAEWVFVKEE